MGRSGLKNGRPWAQILAYIDARAARARLNSVLGHAGWRVDYLEGPRGGVIASVSLRINGEWIAKQDGADATESEPVKGALSSAFKRACAVWGIGEHLYQLGTTWAAFSESGAQQIQIEGQTFRWDPPLLGAATLPTAQVDATRKGARAHSPQSAGGQANVPETMPQTPEAAELIRMPFGKHRGRPLSALPIADLRSARDWAIKHNRKYPAFVAAVDLMSDRNRDAA